MRTFFYCEFSMQRHSSIACIIIEKILLFFKLRACITTLNSTIENVAYKTDIEPRAQSNKTEKKTNCKFCVHHLVVSTFMRERCHRYQLVFSNSSFDNFVFFMSYSLILTSPNKTNHSSCIHHGGLVSATSGAAELMYLSR